MYEYYVNNYKKAIQTYNQIIAKHTKNKNKTVDLLKIFYEVKILDSQDEQMPVSIS